MKMNRGFKILRRLFSEGDNKIEIFIDDVSYMVDPKLTVFQACHEQGIVIPRFCYHEKLSIAGSCRMCLVEVEKAPKPVAACSAGVMKGMRIKTASELTRIARGGVMEFLLANHPLDCPICDQGGECDLQGISYNYGYGEGRFIEFKRAVEDKNVGPLISTVMNRCIHCTRCIRFSEEVAGIFDLGTIGRGQDTEIGTYIEKMVTSELSGNLVDLCPVGALTNAPYSFTTRPWELQRTYSIDLMEAIIPNVEFNTRGPEIMRVLPRLHEDVNEEWISDKSRYSYDGIKRQRLAVPLEKNSETKQFEEIRWETAMTKLVNIFSKLDGKNLLGLVGQFTSLEGAVVLKDLLNGLNCDNFMFDKFPFKSFTREDFLFNRTIPEIEELDTLLLIGTNPKLESSVLNARILKAVKHHGLKVYKVGPQEDLTYDYIHLGNTINVLNQIYNKKHPFYDVLKKSKNSHIILGTGLCSFNKNSDKILKETKNFCKKLNQEEETQFTTSGVLHRFVGPVSGYEMGLNYSSIDQVKDIQVVLNFGNDNDELLKSLKLNEKKFVVYFGSHGDIGASQADLVLPIATWSEQDATYISTEGRVQTSKLAVRPPALAKDEWMVLRALAEEIDVNLNYDNLEELRYRMAEFSPAVLKYDYIEPYSLFERKNGPTNISNDILISMLDNYYKTDPISKSSLIMSKCSSAFNTKKMSNLYTKQNLK